MKSVRMFIVGLVSGVMLATAGTAFAASETVQATFEKFVLIVNGSEPQEIEPLTYKGTTYLPLRETANRLGYDVTYKADGKTITLTKQPEKDVSDVNAVQTSEMTGWVSLRELSEKGITVTMPDTKSGKLHISNGSVELVFDIPRDNQPIYNAEGFGIKSVDGITYVTENAASVLLNQ